MDDSINTKLRLKRGDKITIGYLVVFFLISLWLLQRFCFSTCENGNFWVGEKIEKLTVELGGYDS